MCSINHPIPSMIPWTIRRHPIHHDTYHRIDESPPIPSMIPWIKIISLMIPFCPTSTAQPHVIDRAEINDPILLIIPSMIIPSNEIQSPSHTWCKNSEWKRVPFSRSLSLHSPPALAYTPPSSSITKWVSLTNHIHGYFFSSS